MQNDILEYSGGIRYSGKATLKVSNGKKIIKTIKVHNTGNAPLFNFIAHCLAADYSVAEDLRPVSVKLFSTAGVTDPSDPTKNAEWATIKSYEQQGKLDDYSTELSGIVGTNTNATLNTVVERTSSTVPSASVTLHFLIPYSFISTGKLSQFRLYPKSIGTETNNFSAVFFLTETPSVGATTYMSCLDIDSGSNNYSLILDWELTIKGEY